jgi:hypothetical protein
VPRFAQHLLGELRRWPARRALGTNFLKARRRTLTSGGFHAALSHQSVSDLTPAVAPSYAGKVTEPNSITVASRMVRSGKAFGVFEDLPSRSQYLFGMVV